MKQNQSGFSVVEALLLILVLSVIGFGGWYVWHANQTDKKTTTTNTSSTPSPTSSSDDQSKTVYFTIPTGNVRLPLTSELSGLTAGTAEDTAYSATDKSVAVLAPELDTSWTCVADSDGSKGTIGTVSITTDAQRAGPGSPVATKKIGTYTYGFEPGGANCTTSAKYNELVKAFTAQFSSLESN